MKLFKSALTLSIAAVLTLGSLPAQAREGRQGGMHSPQRHDFKFEGERQTRNDRIIKRQTEQQATDKGFKRNTTVTNDQGQTATRQVEVVNDKDAGVRTRTMTGTTFDGKTVSGQSVTTRTDDGFTRQDSFTGPNGQTSTRQVDVSRDAEAGTVTKNVTTTNPKGETHTHSSTHTFQPKP